MTDVPLYDVDLFTKENLDNPFPHYDAIRELGPVVRLRAPNPDVLVLSRFRDVTRALQSPAALISGKGTGFNAFINQEVAEPGVLASDGARHRKMRMPLMKYLAPPVLASIRPDLDAKADVKLAALADGSTREAISEIASLLPVDVISELVGLPEGDRKKMLKWASSSFNVLGPIDRDGEPIPELIDDLATAGEVIRYLKTFDPASLRPGSWAAELFEQVQTGGMTVGDARVSLRAFVLPSLDTTINAAGNLLYLLGTNPDQYQRLRAEPELIPSAVLEAMRHTTIVRWFSRVAVEDYRADDVFIPAGERVMLLFGAANRDPSKYQDPERFDVARNPADQLGWSAGPHICAGKHLAKMEMEALLKALVKHAAAIEVDAPTPLSNRGVIGIRSMPIRLLPA
ncbi:cytochrome P450 [Sphingopyxis sp.]|uniref:cytochrome P450 n=1 Tax=Sphingopyxis sp. TaxID=1908224 RepID=UPI002B47B8E5|nr:cytochrome P450 [Sphingopyxis sp.]HJS09759.1 cytochrome P450 [Sphingopyxis sp.]